MTDKYHNDNYRHNKCPNYVKCKNLKRKESVNCRDCSIGIGYKNYNKKAIRESFGKLFN